VEPVASNRAHDTKGERCKTRKTRGSTGRQFKIGDLRKAASLSVQPLISSRYLRTYPVQAGNRIKRERGLQRCALENMLSKDLGKADVEKKKKRCAGKWGDKPNHLNHGRGSARPIKNSSEKKTSTERKRFKGTQRGGKTQIG